MCHPWPARVVPPVALLVLVLTACPSGGGGSKGSAAPTRAEVFSAGLAAEDPTDTDGDGLPDEVEEAYAARLGTDPAKKDTNGDGVDDAAAVFEDGWIYFASGGLYGILDGGAAAGRADAPSAPAATEQDSDGDGVPDYLEFAGCRFDWAAGTFVLDPAGFRTDPMQFSTDQDAYGDGMEISKLNMDVAVMAPGDDPLVPAYPNLYVELVGYNVTLNADVETTRGTERTKESNWSSETGGSHEHSVEHGGEVGVEVGWDSGFSAKASVKYSYKNSSTDTTSWNSTLGGSTADTTSWSEAYTSNPTEAARLKLFVRVQNRGTAPLSNVVPTISLRIGGADVATFEPPGLSIAALRPGEAFPPDDGVSWVIDRVRAESGESAPLMLTDWELRALGSGAPVSISVAQKRGDVMRLEDGAWVKAGDVSDYTARILSSSADLQVEVGPGDTAETGRVLHVRVAADDGPTSPEVTLGAALARAMGFRKDATGRYEVKVRHPGGVEETVPLAGTGDDDGQWRWEIDPFTLLANGVDPGHHANTLTLERLLALRLAPYSRVVLRTPRPLAQPGPAFYSAYATPLQGGYRVVACVSDYDGLARVAFVDAAGAEREMTRDGRGPWFFSVDLAPAEGDDTVRWTGRERVRAVSLRTRTVTEATATREEPLTTEVALGVVEVPAPQPAIVQVARLTAEGKRFYARIAPATDRFYDAITSVLVYQGPGAAPSVALTPVGNGFEDPNGWEATFPSGVVTTDNWRLVVATKGGKYRVMTLMTALSNLTPGVGSLGGYSVYIPGSFDVRRTPMIDLDPRPVEIQFCNWNAGAGCNHTSASSQLDTYRQLSSPTGDARDWTPAEGLPDLTLIGNVGPSSLGFHVAGLKLAAKGDAAYQALTGAQIAALAALPPDQGGLQVGFPVFPVAPGDVFAFTTSEGQRGKLIVRSSFVLCFGACMWDMGYEYALYPP